MTQKQALKMLINLYTDPEKWCQGSAAQDANGDAVTPDNPAACKWCLIGACALLGIPLGDVFSSKTGDLLHVIMDWNDDSERTQADVLAMLEHKLRAA